MNTTIHAVATAFANYKGNAYAILQLPVEDDKTFRSFDDIGGTVEWYNYKMVYEGILGKFNIDKINYILEDIYEKLNIAHPADYRARSLSVSDIVAIKHDNKILFYFCDRIGFRYLQQHDLPL